MAGNRKLPFGYRMELGKIAIHPEEVPIVQHIFQQYILGASYNPVLVQRGPVPQAEYASYHPVAGTIGEELW